MAAAIAHGHLVLLTEDQFNVLKEALEIHVEGLKEAKQEATKDRTLEKPEDLLSVASDLDKDIAAGEHMLKELFHVGG